MIPRPDPAGNPRGSPSPWYVHSGGDAFQQEIHPSEHHLAAGSSVGIHEAGSGFRDPSGWNQRERRKNETKPKAKKKNKNKENTGLLKVSGNTRKVSPPRPSWNSELTQECAWKGEEGSKKIWDWKKERGERGSWAGREEKEEQRELSHGDSPHSIISRFSCPPCLWKMGWNQRKLGNIDGCNTK